MLLQFPVAQSKQSIRMQPRSSCINLNFKRLKITLHHFEQVPGLPTGKVILLSYPQFNLPGSRIKSESSPIFIGEKTV